ncbi:MAG: hypothetical protein WD992_03030 [Candidatus Levyibacteriota bacterium]
MRYLQSKYIRSFSVKDLMLFFTGIGIISLHVFFLPFYIWTAGIVRPWYILQGLVPYKDFVWLRMPFDLFLLSGWYEIFGPNGEAYQYFVYTLFILISLSLFLISRKFIGKCFWLPFVFFIVFLFPLFQNVEEDEMLIGLFNLILFGLMLLFFNKRRSYLLLPAGIISGLSLVTKQNSGLVIIAVLSSIFLDFFLQKYRVEKLAKNILILLSGILLPVSLVVFYFLIRGGLKDFLYYTIYFIFGPLRTAYITQGDGLWIIAGYMSLLIPFVLFWKKTGIKLQVAFFITAQILFLLPSLFPSALSYKAFTSFPLISLIAGLNLSLLVRKNSLTVTKKIVVIASFILFIFFTSRFIESYIGSIQSDGFAKGQYLMDWGEQDKEIATIIKNNSQKDDKILSYKSEMIYVLSDRLPANKYVDPFPYLLTPYEETIKVFKDNPAKFVVYDESLPDDHPGLSEWPFLEFLEENYTMIKKFSDTVIVYKLNSK